MHRLHRGAVRLKLARDQLTRAAYASFAFWGWFLYGFGPAVPLLRDEQRTSRAVAGLHGTALALGTVLSAAISVPLVRRFERRGTLIGATVVAAARHRAAGRRPVGAVHPGRRLGHGHRRVDLPQRRQPDPGRSP